MSSADLSDKHLPTSPRAFIRIDPSPRYIREATPVGFDHKMSAEAVSRRIYLDCDSLILPTSRRTLSSRSSGCDCDGRRNSRPPRLGCLATVSSQRHEDEVGALDGSVHLRSLGEATPLSAPGLSIRIRSSLVARSPRRTRLPRRRDGSCLGVLLPRTVAITLESQRSPQLRARLTRRLPRESRCLDPTG